MMHGINGVYVGNVIPNNRLKIPAIAMGDGPQGFRVTGTTGQPGSTTAWPSSLTVAASWDTEIAYKWAAAMAVEFKGKGANMFLGPGIGFARVPTGGRNFEYLCGEDPKLGAEFARKVVKGIQDQGVIANAKHWVNNEIETDRKQVSADVSERTRFEIYYPPFEAAVDAGVLSVMCSYNRINDVSSCENNNTMEHLKKTFGFDGWVVSDWLATYSSVPSLNAGLDMEMPLGLFYSPKNLQKLLDAGEIKQSRIDDSIYRVLTAMYKIGLFDNPPTGDPLANVTSPEHNSLAREISAKSMILLKNDRNFLPVQQGSLSDTACIAVIGDDATVVGDGSGKVTPGYVITPQQGILNALADMGLSKVQVLYSAGKRVDDAVLLAQKCQIAVVNVATTSSEGLDRSTLALGNNQDSLVMAVAQANQNTIVTVVSPGAVLMPWSNQVPAIVSAMMPGQEYGNALADVLFGKVNPSARLPVTMPNKDNEIGFTPEQFPGTGKPPDAIYSEELLVGYRWYLANNVSPLFPFGHGLSYTSFGYSNLNIVRNTPTCEIAEVSLEVTNTGKVNGTEVVQLYIAYPDSAGEPPRQLRGFVKTLDMAPNANPTTVRFCLAKRDVSVWDESGHNWSVVLGQFKLFIGASVNDVRLTGELQL